jgi:hypothetical protein
LFIVVGTFQKHEARIKIKNEVNVEATQVNGIVKLLISHLTTKLGKVSHKPIIVHLISLKKDPFLHELIISHNVKLQ